MQVSKQEVMTFLRENPETVYLRQDPTPEVFRSLAHWLWGEVNWSDDRIFAVMTWFGESHKAFSEPVLLNVPPLPWDLKEDLEQLYKQARGTTHRAGIGRFEKLGKAIAPTLRNNTFVSAYVDLFINPPTLSEVDRNLGIALRASGDGITMGRLSRLMTLFNPYLFPLVAKSTEELVERITGKKFVDGRPEDYFGLAWPMRRALWKLNNWLRVPAGTIIDFPSFDELFQAFGTDLLEVLKIQSPSSGELTRKAAGKSPASIESIDFKAGKIQQTAVALVKKQFVEKGQKVLYLPAYRSCVDFEVMDKDKSLFVMVKIGIGAGKALLSQDEIALASSLLPYNALVIAVVENPTEISRSKVFFYSDPQQVRPD